MVHINIPISASVLKLSVQLTVTATAIMSSKCGMLRSQHFEMHDSAAIITFYGSFFNLWKLIKSFYVFFFHKKSIFKGINLQNLGLTIYSH